MRLELPQVTPWINSNDRYHWAKKAQLTKAWRDQADLAARLHGGYFTERVHITITFHKTTARTYDAANLYPTAKACVDGLVSAGVLADDSNEYVQGPDMRAGEKRPQACVVITIHPLAEEAA